MADDPVVYSMTDAARILKFKRETVSALIKRGVLVGVFVGRRWRIRREDLEAFLTPKAAEQPPEPPAPPNKAKPRVVKVPKEKPADLKRYGPGSEPGAVHARRRRA